MNESYDRDFAQVAIRLLKAPLYDDDQSWNILLDKYKSLSEYFSKIGLIVNIQESEGFAYLSHPEKEDDEEDIPRLVRRIPLSFEVSLLCVILREELERFDLSDNASRRLFLTMRELRERIRFYFREKTDETRLIRQLEKYIRQTVNLGFLKEVSHGDEKTNREPVFEVMRIVKARVNPDFLAEFRRKMEVYVRSL